MVKAFQWSLYDIDHTDIESLLPFINRVNQQPEEIVHTAFCDEVNL